MIRRRLIESRKSLTEEFKLYQTDKDPKSPPQWTRGHVATSGDAKMYMASYEEFEGEDDGDVLNFLEETDKGDYEYAFKIKNKKKWMTAGPDDIEIAVKETPKGLDKPIFVKKGGKAHTALANLFASWQVHVKAADIKDVDEREKWIKDQIKATAERDTASKDDYSKARHAMIKKIKGLKSYDSDGSSTDGPGKYQKLKFKFSEWDHADEIIVKVKVYFNEEATGQTNRVKCVIIGGDIKGKSVNPESIIWSLARAVSEEGQGYVFQDEIDHCEAVAEFLGGKWTGADGQGFSNKHVCLPLKDIKSGEHLYMARALWSKKFIVTHGTSPAAKNDVPSKELDTEAAEAMGRHMDTSKTGGLVSVGTIMKGQPDRPWLYS